LATPEAIRLLDAVGRRWVLVETVGVGQVEVEIAGKADTTVVVVNPGWGDSVQANKAGLMEIADIFLVNKADRPGADRMRSDLELMLGLRSGGTLKDVPAHHGVDLGRSMTDAETLAMNPARAARKAAAAESSDSWTPPVLRTVASKGEGIDVVIEAIDKHFRYLETSGTLRERRRVRLRDRVVDVVEQRVRQRLWTDAATNAWLDERLADLEAGTTNPFDLADALLARSTDLLTRTDR
jgi:LAO/AO transport system kinase